MIYSLTINLQPLTLSHRYFDSTAGPLSGQMLHRDRDFQEGSDRDCACKVQSLFARQKRVATKFK